jgi:adenine deaminase
MTTLTLAEVKADYEEFMQDRGANGFIRRYARPSNVPTDYAVRLRLYTDHNYAAHQLAGSVSQGDRSAIVLVSDLDAVSFPHPIKIGDKVVLGGKEKNVEFVDNDTRAMQNVLVAYELRVRG